MSNPTLFHYFFLPIIFIFVGWLTPQCKNIGPIGYRTPRSMKNQENWDFSQQLSGKLMLLLGSMILLINLLFYLDILPPTHFQLVDMILIGGGILLVILITEIRLYLFDKNTTN